MIKNVIIYGIRGFREEIEANLSDNYFITGYSDSDPIYRNISEYEYKPFYNPNELLNIRFDFIIITHSKQEVSKQIVNSLISIGIPQQKIIETCYVINSVYNFDIPLTNYMKLNRNFDGLFLGMSYSYNAFFTHYFSKSFYKLSYFGGDIYFHYNNIRHIYKNNIDLLSNVKYIVFDMPYYAFNWDLSKASRTIRWRFSLLESFNDYHHYGNTQEELWYIKEYQILKDMFSRISEFNSSSSSNNFEHSNLSDFSADKGFPKTLEHVWTSLRDSTITENIDLMEEMFSSIKAINPEIKLAIVVSPMYLSNLIENQLSIKSMKNIFYNILSENFSEYNIQIIDCFEMFQDKSLFSDIHHLNTIGGHKLSSYLNSRFEECLY